MTHAPYSVEEGRALVAEVVSLEVALADAHVDDTDPVEAVDAMVDQVRAANTGCADAELLSRYEAMATYLYRWGDPRAVAAEAVAARLRELLTPPSRPADRGDAA